MSTRQTVGQQGCLTIAEVQDRLSVCRATVEKLIRSGRLPARRMGRLILIPEADLAAFLKALPAAF